MTNLDWTPIRNGIRAVAGTRTYYVSPIATGEFELLYRMDLTHVGYYADMDTAKAAANYPKGTTMLSEYLQIVPTALLADAASGRIDLNELARAELRSRGMDNNGQWAGFSK